MQPPEVEQDGLADQFGAADSALLRDRAQALVDVFIQPNGRQSLGHSEGAYSRMRWAVLLVLAAAQGAYRGSAIGATVLTKCAGLGVGAFG